LLVIFALLDPDPDPATQINAVHVDPDPMLVTADLLNPDPDPLTGLNRDPDPKHCTYRVRNDNRGISQSKGPISSAVEIINYGIFSSHWVRIHIPRTDPDPGQPKNTDPRGSGSISIRYGSGSGSFYMVRKQ
jgi:hypothetical protein